RFSKPEPLPQQSSLILYQDRLYDEHTETRERDATVTYAVARVDEPSRASAGAVLVAFRMDPTNTAIRGKYFKGFGIVIFFVGLILAQNFASRREKLRLLEIESRHAAAKEAVRAAAPEPQERGELRVAGAIAQAAGT